MVMKISNKSSLVTTTDLNTKTSDLRTKCQGNLLSKTAFDNEFISFNRKIASNRTNYYLEVQKKTKQSNNKIL